MKKLFITSTVLFSLLASAIIGISLWQGKNIESILMGAMESPEEIEKQRSENQICLVDDLNEYLSVPVREMTEEEKQQIEKGEVTVADVYQKIFEERVNEQSPSATVTENNAEKSVVGKDAQAHSGEKSSQKKEAASKPDSNTAPEEGSKPSEQASVDKDSVISKHMAELYRLQNEYTARAEATISQGASYYESLKKEKGAAAARTSTITKFTPIVRGMESECDAKVDAVISALTNDLKKIGADTSIVNAIKTSYESEKQLKLSYYSNKYLN